MRGKSNQGTGTKGQGTVLCPCQKQIFKGSGSPVTLVFLHIAYICINIFVNKYY